MTHMQTHPPIHNVHTTEPWQKQHRTQTSRAFFVIIQSIISVKKMAQLRQNSSEVKNKEVINTTQCLHLSCKDKNNKPHKNNTKKIKQSASFPFWISNIFTYSFAWISCTSNWKHCLKKKNVRHTKHSQTYTLLAPRHSVQYKMVCVLGNTLMRSSLSLRNVLNIASEMVPMFVWLPISQACKHAQTHIIFCLTYKSVVKVTCMLSAVTCTVNSLPAQTRPVLQQGYHW